MLSCIFFLFAGLLLAPLIGIEGDEPLFVQAMYPPRVELYTLEILNRKVPLMLMTYVGTLKSWIYTPIFQLFGTDVMSMRVPVLLAGAASLWLLYLLLRRIAGERAGLIGCALLAVDSMYLVTTCFDWGPVALQHLLVLGGMLLTLRFYQERQAASLAGAFFLFGLALWDKAIALWMLSGLGIGVILTFPRQFFVTLTWRRLAIAVLAFGLGSLPLLIFNLNNHWDTFRGNFQLDTRGIPGKAKLLTQTAEGGGLMGWLTAPNWQTPVPRSPRGFFQQASAKISALAGSPRKSLLLYLFGLALLISPLAGRAALRTILFCLVVMTVAWLQMVLNANTGGSVHHTILMWPLPELIIAVSLAGVSRRLGRAGIPAVAVVLAAAMVSGALVTNEYYAQAVRYGGGQAWTDAIFALSRSLEGVPKRYVFTLDWGIADPLRLLNGGRLMLATGNEQTSKPEVSPEDRAIVLRMLNDPENLYLAHTKAYEMFEGSAARFVKYAGEAGFAPDLIQTVSDSHGRPVYEIYKFKPKV